MARGKILPLGLYRLWGGGKGHVHGRRPGPWGMGLGRASGRAHRLTPDHCSSGVGVTDTGCACIELHRVVDVRIELPPPPSHSEDNLPRDYPVAYGEWWLEPPPPPRGCLVGPSGMPAWAFGPPRHPELTEGGPLGAEAPEEVFFWKNGWNPLILRTFQPKSDLIFGGGSKNDHLGCQLAMACTGQSISVCSTAPLQHFYYAIFCRHNYNFDYF